MKRRQLQKMCSLVLSVFLMVGLFPSMALAQDYSEQDPPLQESVGSELTNEVDDEKEILLPNHGGSQPQEYRDIDGLE